MLILIGESRRQKHLGTEPHPCIWCATTVDAQKMQEREYATVLFIPLFSYGEAAQWLECPRCHHSLAASDDEEPPLLPALRLTLAWLMLGYGLNRGDYPGKVYRQVSLQELDENQWEQACNEVCHCHIEHYLEAQRQRLSPLDRALIVDGACQVLKQLPALETDDRARINRLAGCLDIDWSWVAGRLESDS